MPLNVVQNYISDVYLWCARSFPPEIIQEVDPAGDEGGEAQVQVQPKQRTERRQISGIWSNVRTDIRYQVEYFSTYTISVKVSCI